MSHLSGNVKEVVLSGTQRRNKFGSQGKIRLPKECNRKGTQDWALGSAGPRAFTSGMEEEEEAVRRSKGNHQRRVL